MSAPAHPLLALVDASKNDLKVSLTNYINFQVESQFGQLRNRIVAMIESGEIVSKLVDVNAPVSTQANEHLSTDQITCPPTPSAHHITTEPLIKQQCLDINQGHEFDDVKEEYDDDNDDDEGEYMSDCDEECEDCVKGICQSNQSDLVRENDNANEDAQVGPQIGSNLDVIEDEPNASMANDLVADVIDEQANNGQQQQMDKHGTSTNTNQVTGTTESIGEEAKEVIKQEIKKEYDEEDRDICIKREDVPEYIKTESSDDEDVKEIIKLEIKEECEDDHDDDYECDRDVVKREMASDDEANSMQLDDSFNVDQVAQSTQVVQSSDSQANIDQVINRENALTGEGEQDLAGDDDEMLNTANDNHEGSVVVSNEPSTSARRASNRFTSKQATGSTSHNVTKRKQAQLNRTVKRQKTEEKKTTQDHDDEDEEDNDNEDREEAKIKVINLNCTMSNCHVKLNSLDDLHNHLRTVHQLLPFQCFASNCNIRFDDRKQISSHILWHHSQSTQFLCAVCLKEFDSQRKTHKHWYFHHQNGQFKCNLVNDCAEVTDTRNKMRAHQLTKHHSQSKHFPCTHVGCSASFAFKCELKRHELTHLNTRPFYCIWPECNIRSNRRASLVRHIRVQHFGLPRSVKEQKAKNIVDVQDPNEYVRVVADE